ncbi:MAG: MarR family winged helix-turn-helix transcriptional regulator [Syntrophales bacterium]
MKSFIISEFSKKGINATPTQTAVLYLLEQKDGRKISDFASLLEIKNPAMTGVIDRMEKSGLVIRRPDPADRRATSIFITPQGRELSSKARSIVRKISEKMESGLPAQEIETCKKVLDHFYRKIKS